MGISERCDKLLYPLKTPVPRADLEVAFGDAEIDGGVAGEEGEAFPRLHLVTVVEDEGELLLVDGGGSHQGGFHSAHEPLGESLPVVGCATVFRHVGDGPSLRMRHPLRGTVAERHHAD